MSTSEEETKMSLDAIDRVLEYNLRRLAAKEAARTPTPPPTTPPNNTKDQ